MSITTTTDLPAPIRQSLAAGMLSVPTPNFNYIIPADKYAMPRNGGTTMRFLRPNPLVPPTTPLGNTGIEPTSQVATRNIIDATISFYGTSVILNEQVIIQDFLNMVLSKLSLIDLELHNITMEDKGQAQAA